MRMKCLILSLVKGMKLCCKEVDMVELNPIPIIGVMESMEMGYSWWEMMTQLFI